MMEEAKAAGAKLVSFGELCLPGYMVGDNWEDMAFVNDCLRWNYRIVERAIELGVTAVFGSVTNGDSLGPVGAPSDGNYEDGRPVKYNSAIVCGTASGIYNKTNRPNYREFDDKRYFAKGNGAPHPERLGKDAWLTTSICEDGWDDDYEDKPITVAREQLLYESSPHVHLNLSCSPYTQGKNGARNRRFARHSEGFSLLCYVNCVGTQNNGKDVFCFDGSTTAYCGGLVLGALPPLQECIGYLSLEGGKPQLLEGPWLVEQRDPELHEVLTYGIKNFLEDAGIGKAVIGLSGGIDSALSAMLHVRAIGPENVLLVNMPSRYNSKTTKDIAKEIAQRLRCPYIKVPITAAVEALKQEIDGALAFKDLDKGFRWDDENIQARMRGAGIQAALAAGMRGVLPNNGNKAEVMVGYCTIGGDMMGYLAPIGDLWKSEVYAVSRKLSDLMGGILPDSIFTLVPSAELSAEQDVDKGQGDPIVYWYHEKLFASWMEPWQRKNIEDSLQAYADGVLLEHLGLAHRATDFESLFPTPQAFVADLERWWKLFKGIGVAKRVQAPPVLVVSRRAFGYDFREALGTLAFTLRYAGIKETLLGGPDAH